MLLRPRSAWLCLAALGACIRPAAYPCDSDLQCDLELGGICQLPDGFCAYEDDGCMSGLRFESAAPGTLAGACVGESEGETESSSDTQSSTTAGGGCGEPLQECCEPDDSCDGPWECAGAGCTCTLQIVSGDVHTCWFQLDGVIECWGGNDRGELGRTDPGGSLPEPAPIEGVPSVDVVSAAARQHTCVVGSTGDVYCWGDNTDGQADPSQTLSKADPPRLVASDGDGRGWTAEAVGMGPRHTCIVGEGRISCWGNNDAGQLGFTGDGPQEVDTSSLTGEPRAISGGFSHTCVLTVDEAAETDRVYCWGADDEGQLGGGSGDQSGTTPVEVDLGGAMRVHSISASDLHTCALVGPAESGSNPDDGRRVMCWGDNTQGQAVGPNAASRLESPTEVVGLGAGPWILAVAAPEHSCATSDDLDAFCWGNNSAGRVDPVGGGERLGPTEVGLQDAADKRPLLAYPGKFHTCALATDGTVACWGCGGSGQLGSELSSCAAEGGGGFSEVAPTCG